MYTFTLLTHALLCTLFALTSFHHMIAAQEEEVPVLAKCGDILESNVGKISYKVNERYGRNERCTWIVRSPPHLSTLSIRKLKSGFELGVDYVTAHGFDKAASASIDIGLGTNGPESLEVRGPVVVFVFTSDETVDGTGFELEFEFVGNPIPNVDLIGDTFSAQHEGSLTVGGDGDRYGNNRLSVFVMSRNHTWYPDIEWEASIRVFRIQDTLLCNYDGVRVYSLSYDTLTFVGRYCARAETTFGPFLARNLFIFVFYTDASDDDGGFEISWKLR